METVKNIAAALGAVIGVLTAGLTLYAKYCDIRKNALSAAEPLARPEQKSFAAHEPLTVVPIEGNEDRPEATYAAHFSTKSLERAKGLVRAPAIAMIVFGFLSLMFNLTSAGYGFIDEFITPLDSARQQRQIAPGQMTPTGQPREADSFVAKHADPTDEASMVIAIMMFFSFSIASCMAIWAGFNMLFLRSYWFSFAGTIAIMPAACFCCLAGLPVGIWGLVVLMNPEVKSSFH